MNTTIVQERIETAVRNIMSGDNVCGTLLDAAARADADYFRRAVAPVVATYESEAAELRRQRDDALRDAEAKRFALETVATNVPGLPAPVKEAMGRALPGRNI